MFTDFFEKLKDELKKDLPGEKAHVKMAPGIRDYFKPNTKSRKAGVLILLYPKNQELYIAFIRRTEYNGPHSGQISFPGGKAEKVDKDIIDTALRESNEEIGIDPKKVNIFGGAVSLGHPIGCSGTRILVTLMNVLETKNAKRGMASICIGGGEALSLIIERI